MLAYSPPKYLKVKSAIMEQLDAGDLEPHAALPSEREDRKSVV